MVGWDGGRVTGRQLGIDWTSFVSKSGSGVHTVPPLWPRDETSNTMTLDGFKALGQKAPEILKATLSRKKRRKILQIFPALDSTVCLGYWAIRFLESFQTKRCL